MAEPQSSLPPGAYITVGLLIALAALLSWLIASYPGNPSQRSGADDCESIAQQYNQPDHQGKNTGNRPAGVKNNKAAPDNSAADQAKGNIDAERQIAKYNCQLAIYTKDLAYFTKWLVYATTGLIVIGLLQGFFLQRSVRVAERAATEAKDAIVAAQAGADAANTHARAAEEANKINRGLLIATQRHWVSVKLLINGSLTYNEAGANFPLRFTLKNIGHTPAIRAWPHARPVLIGEALDLGQRQRAFFEEVKGPKYHAVLGRTIFPNDEIHIDLTLTMSNEAIAAAQESKFFKDSFEYFIVGFADTVSHFRGSLIIVALFTCS
jgi:hypothetical protein